MGAFQKFGWVGALILGLLLGSAGVRADPPPENFAIALGDTVAEGSPSAGAGRLELPGAVDVYTFTATAGQRVYFDELTGYGCTGSLRWQLSDPDGQILFDQRFAALEGCSSGFDAGSVTFPKSGTYSLRVFAFNDWVEGYSFRLVPVVDQNLALTLGEGVTNTLATPGAVDTYTFTAAAGQRVYFDELTGYGCTGSLRWQLSDPDGQVLFDQRFATLEGCSSGFDAGSVTFPKSGTYSLRVFAFNDWVEGYSFRLVPVVDQNLALTLGEGVTNTLASPGATDTYTFTATAGQRVYFDELTGYGCTGSLRWKLSDPDGQILFDQRFAALEGCSSGFDAGAVTFPKSGTYSLRVSALNDWVEGYSFRLVPIVDQNLALTLGAVVTNTLATPGAVDTYTFTAAAGQRVYFDELTGYGCTGSLRWQLSDPDGPDPLRPAFRHPRRLQLRIRRRQRHLRQVRHVLPPRLRLQRLGRGLLVCGLADHRTDCGAGGQPHGQRGRRPHRGDRGPAVVPLWKSAALRTACRAGRGVARGQLRRVHLDGTGGGRGRFSGATARS